MRDPLWISIASERTQASVLFSLHVLQAVNASPMSSALFFVGLYITTRVVSRVVASTEFDLPSNSLDRGTPPLTPGTILIKGELPTDA